MLEIFDQTPPGLWACAADELTDKLGGPSLIRLPGQIQQPLFVSTLLHGNETTGWDALRDMLGNGGDRLLPRALTLFIGNVHAARLGLRHLDGEPDYNRIWRDGRGAEQALVDRLLAEIERERPIACLDLHNTSGENPVYGCVHNQHANSLALAQHFSDTLVLVKHPQSMLSMALSATTPAVTIECGKPGNPAVTAQISARLRHLLEEIDSHAMTRSTNSLPENVQLLRSVARVRVPDDVSFSLHGADAELQLNADLERYNFREVVSGTVVATVRSGSNARLEAFDDNGVDIAKQFFRRQGDSLICVRSIVPSMFSPIERIVRQDCLCYLMEPIRRIHSGNNTGHSTS
jgi:succinylglutamate desuccinylase